MSVTALGINKITITASQVVPYKPDKNRVNYLLRSSFVAIDKKDGQRKRFRYYGKSGQEEPITINGALILDLEDSVDAANYKTLLLHLETDPELKAIINIIDETKDAQEFADREVEVSSAVYMLTSAYQNNAFEKLANIYRRKYGSVSGVTNAMVLQTLTTLAKQSPAEVLSLAKDAESDVKILIDKAVEKKVMLRDGDAYITSDNRLVAKDEIAMIRMLDENPSFKVTLERQVELAFSVEEPIKRVNPFLEAAGELVTEANMYPDIRDNATLLAKEDILHIVKLGIKTNSIDSKGGKYMVRGMELTREETDAYYENNPAEASRLKEELVGAALWVEAQGK